MIVLPFGPVPNKEIQKDILDTTHSIKGFKRPVDLSTTLCGQQGLGPFWGITHTHTVYVCSSALTPSSARSALAGPRDLQGHTDTA